MPYIDSSLKNGLLFKYIIIKLADEFGFDGLSGRINHGVSKSKLVKLRAELSEAPEHLLSDVKNKISSLYFESIDSNIIKMYGLVRKDFYRKQRSANSFNLEINSSFLKFINGDKVLKNETLNLKRIGLIDDNGEISKFGIDFSYRDKPLHKQCDYLGIPVIEHQTQSKSESVEQCVALDLSRMEGDWFFGENYLWEFLIRNLCEPLLDQLNKMHPLRGPSVRLDDINKVYSPSKSVEVLDFIDKLHEGKRSIFGVRCLIGLNLEDEFLGLFTEKYFSDRIQELYVKRTNFKRSKFERKKHASDMYINEFDVRRIFIAVGHDKFLKILARYLIEPYSSLRGWPDLIGLDRGKVRFVEVKQKDKLTVGQLESLKFIYELFDGGVEIRMIKR